MWYGRYGMAGFGKVRHGQVWQVWSDRMGLGRVRSGVVRFGWVWQVWHGQVVFGAVRFGMAGMVLQGEVSER